MKLLVVLLITLSLYSIQAKNDDVKLKCRANSCQGCASDSSCVWCDNRCIDKKANIRCSNRISDSAKCKESTKNCCEYKGQRYDFGEKFMDDCNNCTCLESGSVSCTKKLCSGNTVGCEAVLCLENTTCEMTPTGPRCVPNNQAPENPSDCEYNGKTYHDGESFPSSDNCNICSCSLGKVRCTLRACLQTCNYQGQIYTEGQTFPSADGCNFCSCTSGRVICTERACLLNCQSDYDCDYGDFCSKDSCDASQGTCMTCNTETICTTLYDPVCGCDGQTYSNNCDAMRSCVNVKSSGECQPQLTSCHTDTDCNSGYFCSKDSCDASQGTCTECKRDRICTAIYDPVCGCDDNTYGSQCVATSACVNVKSLGECQSPTPQPQPLNCRTNNDCGSGDYCAKDTCDCDQGTCTQRSFGCNRMYDPVCGCDGKTYSNQCEAKRLGANMKSRGECPTPQSGGTYH